LGVWGCFWFGKCFKEKEVRAQTQAEASVREEIAWRLELLSRPEKRGDHVGGKSDHICVSRLLVTEMRYCRKG